MRGSWNSAIGRLVCLCAMLSSAGATFAGTLARVDLDRPVQELALPVYACLQDAGGRNYVLVFAETGMLEASGLPFQTLDAGEKPEDYVVAVARGNRRAGDAVADARLIYDDGRNGVFSAAGSQAEALANQGFEIRRLPRRPMRWRAPVSSRRLQSTSRAFAVDERISAMIAQVTSNMLYGYMDQITGGDGTVIGGELYRIETRNTAQQVASHKAAQYLFQHLDSLGMQVTYQHWSSSGYSNCNVVAEWPGQALSNEIVVLIAHFDSLPSGAKAPGADDNASGTIGVLAAASILRHYRFDRTLRFVLVSGEEQGLLGSEVYAQAAFDEDDDLVAVLNLDMISWDGDSDPFLRLHTRRTDSPGYDDDRVIADVFTNVVVTYGLSGHLKPLIITDGEEASDHSSFWYNGFPAILAIEDDWDDFNPNYHSTNDTLAHIHMNYFTWFEKAILGTAAHLALPAEQAPFDLIRVDNGDWNHGGGIGVGTWYLAHRPGASETGPDGYDIAWSNVPAHLAAQWLKIHTTPYGIPLQTDARPAGSETLFQGVLSAVTTNSGTFSCTNLLRFSWPALCDTSRLYTVRIRIESNYTWNAQPFEVITNLRETAGGFVALPGLVHLSNGASYGTCDVATRVLRTAPSNFPLVLAWLNQESIGLTMNAQVGATVLDVVETSTNLLDHASSWITLYSFTNRVAPDADNFDSGSQALPRFCDLPSPDPRAAYFRVRRQWIEP